MKYECRYDVAFQDAGPGDGIRLSRFVEMVVNAIVRSKEARGDGVDVLRAQNAIWVVARLGIEFKALPRRNDALTFETWCERAGRGVVVHDIRVWRDAAGAEGGRVLAAKVRTIWCAMDAGTREIVDVHRLGVPRDEDGERQPLRAVEKEPNGVREVHRHYVRYSDIDANGHCNSGRYFEMMMDALEPGDSFVPTRVEAEYLGESMLGQLLTVNVRRSAAGCGIEIADTDGKTCCRAVIEHTEAMDDGKER